MFAVEWPADEHVAVAEWINFSYVAISINWFSQIFPGAEAGMFNWNLMNIFPESNNCKLPNFTHFNCLSSHSFTETDIWASYLNAIAVALSFDAGDFGGWTTAACQSEFIFLKSRRRINFPRVRKREESIPTFHQPDLTTGKHVKRNIIIIFFPRSLFEERERLNWNEA